MSKTVCFKLKAAAAMTALLLVLAGSALADGSVAMKFTVNGAKPEFDADVVTLVQRIPSEGVTAAAASGTDGTGNLEVNFESTAGIVAGTYEINIDGKPTGALVTFTASQLLSPIDETAVRAFNTVKLSDVFGLRDGEVYEAMYVVGPAANPTAVVDIAFEDIFEEDYVVVSGGRLTIAPAIDVSASAARVYEWSANAGTISTTDWSPATGIFSKVINEAFDLEVEVAHTYSVNLHLRLDGAAPATAAFARRFALKDTGGNPVPLTSANSSFSTTTNILTITGLEDGFDGTDEENAEYEITYQFSGGAVNETGAKFAVGYELMRPNGLLTLGTASSPIQFYSIKITEDDESAAFGVSGKYAVPAVWDVEDTLAIADLKSAYVVVGGGRLEIDVVPASQDNTAAHNFIWEDGPAAGTGVVYVPVSNVPADEVNDAKLTITNFNAKIDAAVTAVPLYNVSLKGIKLDNADLPNMAEGEKFSLRSYALPKAVPPVASVTYKGAFDGSEIEFILLPLGDYEVFYSDDRTGARITIADGAKGSNDLAAATFLTVKFSDSLAAGSPAYTSWTRMAGMYSIAKEAGKFFDDEKFEADSAFAVTNGRVLYADNVNTRLKLEVTNPEINEDVVTSYRYLWRDGTASGTANYSALGSETVASPAAVVLDGAKAINARCALTPLYRVTLTVNKNGSRWRFAEGSYSLGSGNTAADDGEKADDGYVVFDDVEIAENVAVNIVGGTSGSRTHTATGIEIDVAPASRAFTLNYYDVGFVFDAGYCVPGTAAGQCGNAATLKIHTGYADAKGSIAVSAGASNGITSTEGDFLVVKDKDIKIAVNDGGSDNMNQFVYDWEFEGVGKSAVATTVSSANRNDTLRITAGELAGATGAIKVILTPRKITDELLAARDAVWNIIRGANSADMVGGEYQVNANKLDLMELPRNTLAAAAGLPSMVFASGSALVWTAAGVPVNVTAGVNLGAVTLPAFGGVSTGSVTVTASLAGSGTAALPFPMTVLPLLPTDKEALEAVAKVFAGGNLTTEPNFTQALVGPNGWDLIFKGRNSSYSSTPSSNGMGNVSNDLVLPTSDAQVRSALVAVANPPFTAGQVTAAENAVKSLIGVSNVMITWSSDKPAVINPATGAVVRPLFGEAAEAVMLTATIGMFGAESRVVTFPVTVRPFANEDDQLVTALENLLTWNAIRGANTSVSVSGAAEATRDLVLPVNGMFPAVAANKVEGAKITWTLTGGATTAMTLSDNPEDIDDETGPIAMVVTRPSTGADVVRTLTARISLGTIVNRPVVFSVTVPKKGEILVNHISLSNASVVYDGGEQRIGDAAFAAGAWNRYSSGGAIDTVYTYTGVAPTSGYFTYSRKAGAVELGANSALPADAGTYSVIVTFENRDFIGNSASRTLTIQRALLTAGMVEVFAEDLVYDGLPHDPYFEVKFDDDTELALGTHYRGGYVAGITRTAYSNTTNAGDDARVGIEGIGNYRGEVVKTFSVAKRPITFDMTGSGVSAGKVFDGTDDVAASLITVAFNDLAGTETLVNGVDYTLSGKYSSVNAGTVSATVTVELLNTAKANNYTLSSATFTVSGLTITKKALVFADLDVVTKVTYNAEAQGIVVSDMIAANGMTVTYDGEDDVPVDAGEYAVKVIIADGDNYTGDTFEFVYTIEQVVTAKSDLIVGDLEVFGDGEAKTLAVSLPGTGYGEIIVTYDGDGLDDDGFPVELGTYLVTVEVTGGVNYTGGTFTFEFVVTELVSVKDAVSVIPGDSPDVAVITPVRQLSAVFTAGPNPVSKNAGKVAFFWEGKAISGSTLSVFSATGSLVANVSVSDAGVSAARREVGSWNLRDTQGRSVSEGTYLIRGVITGRDGSRERVNYKINVR